jgi:hypothetical protein
MAVIDWDKFAERVPAGTKVRCGGEAWAYWHGILLENYPYSQLEELNPLGRDYARIVEHILRTPQLRIQTFAHSETQYANPIKTMQYFMNGQWRTFDEVMANAS